MGQADLLLELRRAKLQLHSSALVAAQASHSEGPPWRRFMGKSKEQMGEINGEIHSQRRFIAGQNRTELEDFPATELTTGGSYEDQLWIEHDDLFFNYQ